MIAELKVPALIAAGTLAMAQFVAPARVVWADVRL